MNLASTSRPLSDLASFLLFFGLLSVYNLLLCRFSNQQLAPNKNEMSTSMKDRATGQQKHTDRPHTHTPGVHRRPQASTGVHRRPQAPTGVHRRPQANRWAPKARELHQIITAIYRVITIVWWSSRLSWGISRISSWWLSVPMKCSSVVPQDSAQKLGWNVVDWRQTQLFWSSHMSLSHSNIKCERETSSE